MANGNGGTIIKLPKLISDIGKSVWFIAGVIGLVVALSLRFLPGAPELAGLARASELDSLKEVTDTNRRDIADMKLQLTEIQCSQKTAQSFQLFMVMQSSDLTMEEQQRLRFEFDAGWITADSLFKIVSRRAKTN